MPSMVARYGFHWHNQYGSTEGGMMSRVPHHLADELIGTGTMGVEPPGVTIRLVDDDDKDVAAGRGRRGLIGGPGPLCRLPQPARGDGRGQSRRLVPFGRRRAARRARPALFRRPQEGDHPPHAARTSRPPRSRACCARIRRSSRPRWSRCRTSCAARRSRPIIQLPAIGRQFSAGRGDRLLPAEPRRLQDPALHRVPRQDFERTPSMRVQKQSLLKEKSDLRQGAWDRETGKVGDE